MSKLTSKIAAAPLLLSLTSPIANAESDISANGSLTYKSIRVVNGITYADAPVVEFEGHLSKGNFSLGIILDYRLDDGLDGEKLDEASPIVTWSPIESLTFGYLHSRVPPGELFAHEFFASAQPLDWLSFFYINDATNGGQYFNVSPSLKLNNNWSLNLTGGYNDKYNRAETGLSHVDYGVSYQHGSFGATLDYIDFRREAADSPKGEDITRLTVSWSF